MNPIINLFSKMHQNWVLMEVLQTTRILVTAIVDHGLLRLQKELFLLQNE